MARISWFKARPGAIGGLGYTPHEVAKMRPGIVYVSLVRSPMPGPGLGGVALIRSCKSLVVSQRPVLTKQVALTRCPCRVRRSTTQLAISRH